MLIFIIDFPTSDLFYRLVMLSGPPFLMSMFTRRLKSSRFSEALLVATVSLRNEIISEILRFSSLLTSRIRSNPFLTGRVVWFSNSNSSQYFQEGPAHRLS